MKKLVEENLRATMTDPNVPRENHAAAIKSIGEQTEQALVQLLGQAGWKAYKQNGGCWVPGQQGNAVTFRTVSTSGNNVESRGFSFDTATTTSPNPSGASGTSGSGGGERRVFIQSGTPPAKP